MRHSSTRRSFKSSNALVLASLTVGLAACTTPPPRDGEPMPGVSLTAQSERLVLRWRPDSLVVRALSPGSLVEVVADYMTPNGRVTGDAVARAQVGSVNELSLDLAPSVRQAPSGPVCLRLRVNGRSALPLRAAGSGGSSDGFRYDAWALNASANGQRRVLETEREAIVKSYENDRSRLDSFDEWRRSRGLSTAQSCNALTAAPSPRPATALDPSRRDLAAQRECTWRLMHTKGNDSGRVFSTSRDTLEKQKVSFPEDVQKVLPGLIQRLTTADQTVRAQLPLVQRGDYQPLLIPQALLLTSATKEALEKGSLLASTTGLLNSFESCIKDSVSQFQLSFETWQREQDPRLAEGRSLRVRAECRERFAQAQQVSERADRSLQRMNQLEAELAPPVKAQPLPTNVDLIRQRC